MMPEPPRSQPDPADTADGSPGTVMVDHVEYELPGTSLLGRLGQAGQATGHWTRDRFEAELDPESRYHLYLQFKHAGQVHTAEFTR